MAKMTGKTPVTSPAAALERGRALVRAGRLDEAAKTAAAALEAHPDRFEMWNLQSVVHRRMQRPEEALAAAERAIALAPDYAAARVNRGMALRSLHRPIEAVEELRAATRCDRNLAAAWLTLAELLAEHADVDDAAAALDEAIAINPDNLALLEGKAVLLRTSASPQRAEEFLRSLEGRFPDVAWLQFYLGDLVAAHDAQAGQRLLRRACELEPAAAAPRLALIQHLLWTSGDGEGAALDEACALAARLPATTAMAPAESKVLRDLYSRVCAFEAMDRLGDFRTLGRSWAAAGLHTALFRHLARVASDADRRELLEQHRIAADRLAVKARTKALRVAEPRARSSPLRLGFLSSDLRRHPVGYFVEPLFRHLDPARFEIFCYGFDNRPSDSLQSFFQSRATVFRRMPEATSQAAAQAIADDRLDVLIELGGSTQGNRLDVLAHRPAPRQLSWLGYPHSAGLAEIDGLICDPWNLPPDRTMLLERPCVLPRSWIALGRSTFSEAEAIAAEPAEARNGAVTFGTANNPYKYTKTVLRTWAAIAAAVPDARFAFIRPEGGSAVFRANVHRIFEAAGVSPERVVFHAVRGGHLRWYNEIDIALDTFPLTGGTTTVEALWMGAPVVSLEGPAFFERLSWSILANLGLQELVAVDLESYRAIAVDLAMDRKRRAELHLGLRARMKASPLGDAAGFARDFFDLIERVVREETAVATA